MQTLHNFWWLAKPFWTSEQKKPAVLMLSGAIAANLFLVGVNILNNYWNLFFYNSLQKLDYSDFLLGCLMFLGLQVAIASGTIVSFHFQQKLILLWRRWATENTLQQWLGEKRFLKLQLTAPEMDNPDQRIADDIKMFITMSITLSLGILTAVISLFSFISILWQASDLLSFTISGQEVVIPGLLVWAALIYSVLGTGGVFWLGRKLPKLHFLQQKREADFRYSMVRLRENAEAVALYQGEAEEHARFSQRLDTLLDNFWHLIKRQKIVLGYSTIYSRSAVMIPMFIMAPAFFAGAIPLGRLTQISAAFEEVQAAFSYLVDAFPEIAEWKSVIDRLTGFQQRLNDIDIETDLIHQQQNQGFSLDNLHIKLPEGKPLLSGLSLQLRPGERLMIQGESGFGKSTLIRTIAGLWTHASGKMAYNRDNILTLAQKTYLPLGTLRDALYYPTSPAENDLHLNTVVKQCGLDHLLEKLDTESDWSLTLSIGEQQRCAFARALLNKPSLLLLDESTSALDAKSEAQLYQLLIQKLPQTTMISIAHRPSLKQFHNQILVLQQSNRWQLNVIPHTQEEKSPELYSF